MPQVVERIIDHVHNTILADLSDETIAAAKTFILDSIGVCVAGRRATWADPVTSAVLGWGSGADAMIMGSNIWLPAPHAALVNAYQLHAQEFDCVHEGAVVHPMTVVLPSIFAWSQRGGGISGGALLVAAATGVDIAATLGMCSRAPMRFFRPANAGGIGATAALCRLAGLDRQLTRNALGIVYGQTGGTMQAHTEGETQLAMQIGFAARAAVNSVDLARTGMPAPQNMIEGPFGYFALFDGKWDASPFDDLGRVARLTEVSHKPFPTGRAIHGAVDGLQQLMRRHCFLLGQVDRVVIKAPPLIHRLVARPFSPDLPVNAARLCLQYVGAIVLLSGGVGLTDFTRDRLADPAVQDLAARIAVEIDGNADPNALMPQQVEVRLRTGAVHAIEMGHVLGSPQNPLGREHHLIKFRTCWAAAGLAADDGEKVIAKVDELETLADATILVRLTGPGGDR